MKRPKQSRAYVCKVKNSKSRTSASKEYFQVYVEGDRSYLFTTNDSDSLRKKIMQWSIQEDINIASMQVASSSLETVFRKLTK